MRQSNFHYARLVFCQTVRSLRANRQKTVTWLDWRLYVKRSKRQAWAYCNTLLYYNRLHAWSLLKCQSTRHSPCCSQQSSLTLRGWEMLQHFRETGGAEVDAILGSLALGALGANGAKSGQNLLPVGSPIFCRLVFWQNRQNRDGWIELRLCRSSRRTDGCSGCGCGWVFDDCVFAHNKTNKATAVPTA